MILIKLVNKITRVEYHREYSQLSEVNKNYVCVNCPDSSVLEKVYCVYSTTIGTSHEAIEPPAHKV